MASPEGGGDQRLASEAGERVLILTCSVGVPASASLVNNGELCQQDQMKMSTGPRGPPVVHGDRRVATISTCQTKLPYGKASQTQPDTENREQRITELEEAEHSSSAIGPCAKRADAAEGSGQHTLGIPPTLREQQEGGGMRNHQESVAVFEGHAKVECHNPSNQEVSGSSVKQTSTPFVDDYVSNSSASALAALATVLAHSADGTQSPPPTLTSPRMLEQMKHRGGNKCVTKCPPCCAQGRGSLKMPAPETQCREGPELVNERWRPLPLAQHLRTPLTRSAKQIPFSRSASTGTCTSSTPNCSDSVASEEMSLGLMGQELSGETRQNECPILTTMVSEGANREGGEQESVAAPPREYGSAAVSGSRLCTSASIRDTKWPDCGGSLESVHATSERNGANAGRPALQSLKNGSTDDSSSSWDTEKRDAVPTRTGAPAYESFQQTAASQNSAALPASPNVPLASTILADRRSVFYKTQMCPHAMRGRCRLAKGCSFAHHNRELRTPPRLDKTKMCANVKAGVSCPKGESCSFAHSRNELRHTVAFYKTNMCRNWQAGACLHPQTCNHAHGMYELLFFRTLAAGTGCRDFRKEKEVYTGQSVITSRGSVADAGQEGKGGSLEFKSVKSRDEFCSKTSAAGSTDADDHYTGDFAVSRHSAVVRNNLQTLLASLAPLESRQARTGVPRAVGSEAELSQRHASDKELLASRRADDTGDAKSHVPSIKGKAIEGGTETSCTKANTVAGSGGVVLSGNIINDRGVKSDASGLHDGGNMRGNLAKGRRKKGAGVQDGCKGKRRTLGADPVLQTRPTEKIKNASAVRTARSTTSPVMRGDKWLSATGDTVIQKADVCPFVVASRESSVGMTGQVQDREQQAAEETESLHRPRQNQRTPTSFQSAYLATRRPTGMRKCNSQVKRGSTVQADILNIRPAPAPPSAPSPAAIASLQEILNVTGVAETANEKPPLSPAADQMQQRLQTNQRQLLFQLHAYQQARLQRNYAETILCQQRRQRNRREHSSDSLRCKGSGDENSLDRMESREAPVKGWSEESSFKGGGKSEGTSAEYPVFVADRRVDAADKKGSSGDGACLSDPEDPNTAAMDLAYTLLLLLRESAPNNVSSDCAGAAGSLRKFRVHQSGSSLHVPPPTVDDEMLGWTQDQPMEDNLTINGCAPQTPVQQVPFVNDETSGQPTVSVVGALEALESRHLVDLQVAVGPLDALSEERSENRDSSADLWTAEVARGLFDTNRLNKPPLPPCSTPVGVKREDPGLSNANRGCADAHLALAEPGTVASGQTGDFEQAQAALPPKKVTSEEGDLRAGGGVGAQGARTASVALASADNAMKIPDVPLPQGSPTRSSGAALGRLADRPASDRAATEIIMARLNAAVGSLASLGRETRMVEDLLRCQQQGTSEKQSLRTSARKSAIHEGATTTVETRDCCSHGIELLRAPVLTEDPPRDCLSSGRASVGNDRSAGSHPRQQVHADAIARADAAAANSVANEQEPFLGGTLGKALRDSSWQLCCQNIECSTTCARCSGMSTGATREVTEEARLEGARHLFSSFSKGNMSLSRPRRDDFGVKVILDAAPPESGSLENKPSFSVCSPRHGDDKLEMTSGFDLVSLASHGSIESSTASSDISGGAEQRRETGARVMPSFAEGDSAFLRGDHSLGFQRYPDAEQRQTGHPGQEFHALAGYTSDSEHLVTDTSRETFRGARMGGKGLVPHKPIHVRTDDESVQRATVRTTSSNALEVMSSDDVGNMTVADTMVALSRTADSLDCPGGDWARRHELYSARKLLQGLHIDQGLAACTRRGRWQTSCSVGVCAMNEAGVGDPGAVEPGNGKQAAGGAAGQPRELENLQATEFACGWSHWPPALLKAEAETEQDAGSGPSQMQSLRQGMGRQCCEQSFSRQCYRLPEKRTLGAETYRPAGVDPLTLIESMIHALELEG